jgi:hypothetical protein
MPCVELKKTLQAENKNDCFDNSHVAKEHGKRFSFNNTTNKSICRVRIDNCFITGLEKRCDFFFKIETPVKYYLVELKGVKVDEGIKQIISTYENVNSKIKALPQDYTGVIVSSSVPKATDQRFRKLQDKCLREKKLKIRKTHLQHIEPI